MNFANSVTLVTVVCEGQHGNLQERPVSGDEKILTSPSAPMKKFSLGVAIVFMESKDSELNFLVDWKQVAENYGFAGG